MDSYATMFTDSSQTLLIWQVYQFDSFQRYRRMQSSRTWHDAEINLWPIPKYRILSEFWSFRIFFCLRWSNGTHRNPEIVAWRAPMISPMICSKACVLHVCVAPALHCLDEFGVLAAVWKSTSGTLWKRWSMLAALANWNGSRMREHPNIPQLLNYCHHFISRCSPWHDAFGSLMYRSPTNPQPTKGARIFCRFPTNHCQSWGCLWGCQDFTTSMPWLDGCWIWLSYAHDTHIYTYI